MDISTELNSLRVMVRYLPEFLRATSKLRAATRQERLTSYINLIISQADYMVSEVMLAETSNEENDQESDDVPDHLTVVETRRYSTRLQGGNHTIEVGCQSPFSDSRMEDRPQADWEQFYTADGMPKPISRRGVL